MDPSVVSPSEMLEAGRLVLERMSARAGERFDGTIVTHLADGGRGARFPGEASTSFTEARGAPPQKNV